MFVHSRLSEQSRDCLVTERVYRCLETDRFLRLNTLQRVASWEPMQVDNAVPTVLMGTGLLLAGQALSKILHDSS